jgi:DNA-binding NarL/FixJ family response regulator
MDAAMPELDGILATRQILKVVPHQLVIMLTEVDDDDLGLLALRAGAAGFLSKDVDINALPRMLKGVAAGEAAVSRRMTKRVIEQLWNAPPGASSGMLSIKSPLTPREWEVIDRLKAARSTREIAAELTLSPETVRYHVKNILRKLRVHSRREAVAMADRIAAAADRERATVGEGAIAVADRSARRETLQRRGVDRRGGRPRREVDRRSEGL